jgi:hypothetical protein
MVVPETEAESSEGAAGGSPKPKKSHEGTSITRRSTATKERMKELFSFIGSLLEYRILKISQFRALEPFLLPE